MIKSLKKKIYGLLYPSGKTQGCGENAALNFLLRGKKNDVAARSKILA